MAQPDPYLREFNFTNWQASHPSDPLPAAHMDAELNRVKSVTDRILANLATIQRDDTALANQSVGYDQLAGELRTGILLSVPTQWATGTDYTENSTVFHAMVLYRCLVAHTSGTFSTDLAGGKWVILDDFSLISAPAPTADIPLGGFKHTGVGAATARTQYARVDQVQDSAFIWAGTDAGAANAYSFTLTPAVAAYATGQIFYGKIGVGHTNTGACVASFGPGNKSIKMPDGSAPAANALVAGQTYAFLYDGSGNLIVLNPTASQAGLDINGMTALTAPDVADAAVVYDTSAAANRKIVLSDLLKVLNGLTADAAPDGTADYLLSYDASASAAKKVLLHNVFKTINALTADAAPDKAADYLVTYDVSATAPKKVLLNTLLGLLGSTTNVVSVKLKVWTSSATYTPSTGMLYALLGTVGGGGGGAGGNTVSNSGGAGGASGGLSLKLASAADIGASKAVTIGAGGSGGSGGSGGNMLAGANGGDTSIGTLCVGKGGPGAAAGSTSTSNPGPAGAVAGTGDIAGTGQQGQPSLYVSTGVTLSGAGGSTIFGGGGRAVSTAGAGNAGTGYGAGGSGMMRGSSGTNNGGAGAPGLAFAIEFCSQ